MEDKLIKFLGTIVLACIIVYALFSHSCALDNCQQKGNIVFVSDCEPDTDCYLYDLTHFNNPEITKQEDLEKYVFGGSVTR